MTSTETFKPGDMVQSRGRIKARQADRARYIRFMMARVEHVERTKVTVNPVGMRVHVDCKAEDLIKMAIQPAPKPKPEPKEAVQTAVEDGEPKKKVSSIAVARKRKQTT